MKCRILPKFCQVRGHSTNPPATRLGKTPCPPRWYSLYRVSRLSPAFPEHVGSYELLAPIGAGGMATVYLGLARADGLQRQVAVKMIHGTAESDPQLAADLLREAKLVARILHPNVVPVLDVGDDAAGLFLVMEYIEGDNLAAVRRAARRLGYSVPDAIALRI